MERERVQDAPPVEGVPPPVFLTQGEPSLVAAGNVPGRSWAGGDLGPQDPSVTASFGKEPERARDS